MRRQPTLRPIGPLLLAAAVVAACGGAPPAGTFMLAPVVAPDGSAPSAAPGSGAAAPGSGAAAPGSGAAAPGSVVSPPTVPSVDLTPSGSSSVAASPSSDLLGGPVIAIPGLGLSLRLPFGWVGVDSTVPPSIAASTVARHPDLAEPLAALRTGAVGFVGFDAGSTVPPTPRLTIATTGDAIPIVALLETLARHTADQLEKTESISDPEVTPATLAAGPAVELRYRLHSGTAGPDLAVASWFVSAGGHTFLLTFTGPDATADAWRPLVRAIAESLSGG